MTTMIRTASGRTRDLPEHVNPEQVRGLDEDGRIVVADFDGNAGAEFLFGLTLCCNAYDKGGENSIYCRGCYGDDDVGNYLWRNDDGTYRGLDPVVPS